MSTLKGTSPQQKNKGNRNKSSSNASKTQNSADSSNDEYVDIKTEPDIAKSNAKNGRLSHQQYHNSEKVTIKHHQYKAGDLCPTACGGRLWIGMPGKVIKITGQGFAMATQYTIEKLRCSLVGHYLSANLPPTEFSFTKAFYNKPKAAAIKN